MRITPPLLQSRPSEVKERPQDFWEILKIHSIFLILLPSDLVFSTHLFILFIFLKSSYVLFFLSFFGGGGVADIY